MIFLLVILPALGVLVDLTLLHPKGEQSTSSGASKGPLVLNLEQKSGSL